VNELDVHFLDKLLAHSRGLTVLAYNCMAVCAMQMSHLE